MTAEIFGLTHECQDPDCHIPGFVDTLRRMSAEQTPDIADTILRALEDHVPWDTKGRNLGAYRTEWICDCGHAFAVDGHRGETRAGEHRAHVAAALAPVLAAAVREAEQRAWDEGANAAVIEYNAGTRMSLRAVIPFPENPYRADRITEPVSHEAATSGEEASKA